MVWSHYKHLIYFEFHTPVQICHDNSGEGIFMFIQAHCKYCKIPELIPSDCGLIQLEPHTMQHKAIQTSGNQCIFAKCSIQIFNDISSYTDA